MSASAQELTHPARDEIDLAAVLHALSDPVRLGIVAALRQCGDERRCGSFHVPVSKSTLTHHFRVLREAGVIVQRQDGTARLSLLRTDDLEARFPGVIESILSATIAGSDGAEGPDGATAGQDRAPAGAAPLSA
jgi:DNA-binding transcriptional ArsR family regulator